MKYKYWKPNIYKIAAKLRGVGVFLLLNFIVLCGYRTI